MKYHPVTDDNAVWDASVVKSKDDIVLDINDQELNILVDLLRSLEGRKTEELKKSDFRCRVLSSLTKNIHERLQNGKGAVIVRGLPRNKLSDSELCNLFWGLGIGMGRPVVQNLQGSRIGHVRNERDNPTNRGYMSNRELGFHSDAFEIVGLMCLSGSASGGVNQIVSGLNIYNHFVKNSPELLDALFDGFYYATAERQGSNKPYTDYKVPVFSRTEGKVSSMCLGAYMRSAAKIIGEPLPDKLDEGLRQFYEMCNRQDFMFEFMLEPGEILFLNNYTTLHSRTEFTDDETHQRHLLRLWLEIPEGRPVVPSLTARGRDYEQLFMESIT